jgi:hypothetical protein
LLALAQGREATDTKLSTLVTLLNDPDGPLSKCQTELLELHSRLSLPVTGIRGLGRALLWPLKDKEIRKTLDIIRAQKATCNLALNIDNT